jgi:hypothetical protein
MDTYASAASAASEVASRQLLLPQTNIVELDGGGNLAALLFAYTFYQGLFTTGRPAEWVLPYIAAVFAERESPWYIDYKEGYAFVVPPVMEAARCAVFLAIGVLASQYLITALESSFYGYSTAFCLALPAALLSLARPKLKTRQVAELQSAILTDFKDFARNRLVRVVGRKSVTAAIREMDISLEQYQKRSRNGASNKLNLERDKNCVSESSIILAFRRSYTPYRDETLVADKEIRAVVRSVIGYKPLEGVYIDLKLLNLRKESREENKRLVNRANEQRELALAGGTTTQQRGEEEETYVDTLGSDFIR